MNGSDWDSSERDRVMRETSKSGVDLLKTLAVSIRGDQDYGIIDYDPAPIGALRSRATPEDVAATLRDYRPPYDHLTGFTPLGLRQALNKIVHSRPTGNSFFADNETHDLILSGNDRGTTWLAVISLIDLCRIIKSLPDAKRYNVTQD